MAHTMMPRSYARVVKTRTTKDRAKRTQLTDLQADVVRLTLRELSDTYGQTRAGELAGGYDQGYVSQVLSGIKRPGRAMANAMIEKAYLSREKFDGAEPMAAPRHPPDAANIRQISGADVVRLEELVADLAALVSSLRLR